MGCGHGGVDRGHGGGVVAVVAGGGLVLIMKDQCLTATGSDIQLPLSSAFLLLLELMVKGGSKVQIKT